MQAWKQEAWSTQTRELLSTLRDECSDCHNSEYGDHCSSRELKDDEFKEACEHEDIEEFYVDETWQGTHVGLYRKSTIADDANPTSRPTRYWSASDTPADGLHRS